MMKAAILTEDGFQLEEMAIPTIGEREMLIKTTACGVCSGDLFVYQNREDFIQTYNRLGHEGSGEVVAVGSQVSGFKVGDLVTAWTIPAYSEFFAASPHEVVKLPESVSPDYALGEAVACCIHAGNRFGVRPGDKVAVIGLGFMGLICQQIAKAQGAGDVIGIDPMADRTALSLEFGAKKVYNPFETSAEALIEAHGLFDVVIEAAGVQSAVDLSTELVNLHGRIILVGYHQSNGGMRTVNMERWNYKAIDVINGHVRREDEKLEAMRLGVDWMAKGLIDTEPIVSFFEFDEIEGAFQKLDSRQPGF